MGAIDAGKLLTDSVLPASFDEIMILSSFKFLHIKILQKLHCSVHNLISNGKAFGYLELSIEARSLEQTLKSLIQKDVSLAALQSTGISQQILELKRISTEHELTASEDMTLVVSGRSVFLSNIHTSNLIFVVEEDTEAAQELVLQLRYYGNEVEVFNHLDRFRIAVQHKPDAIVLMGVEFTDDKMAGIHVMEEIQRNLARPVRVIFISAYDEMIFRLGVQYMPEVLLI